MATRSAPLAIGISLHPYVPALILTAATWVAVCGAFTLEVVRPHDAVEDLYRLDAARDALARAAAPEAPAPARILAAPAER